MRQIGTLPTVDEARRFSDYLLTLGMTTRLMEQPDGACAVWVHNEDHVAPARRELETFQQNPDDPRYRASGASAESVRRESERRDREFRKNYRELRGHRDGPNLRRRPLTFGLIAVCIAVFLWKRWPGAPISPAQLLSFSTVQLDALGQPHSRGLEDILRGQAWRLITPIFLHFNEFHILFNMWALAAIGTLIEYRRGTRALAALVLLSAIASNVGQYLYLQEVGRPLATFGGMSGVVYALFGYVWMKGRYEPEQGMILHPSSVQIMLFWLVLCMTGMMGSIANAAHVIGLIVGLLYGLARF